MKKPFFAPDHKGFMIDYHGLLGQAQISLKHNGEAGLAGMLEQLKNHMTQLGELYYSGDMAVVDEFLQLYCVADEERVKAKADGNL